MRKLTVFWSLLIVMSLLIPSAAFAQGPVLIGGYPDFDATAAEEEGYWYSRYNMGSLTMMAGLGDTFMPDMAMIQQMIQMADADPNDGDTAMPPMNAALLKTIFASADPHFIQPIDMTMRDFGTMRWDPSTFDTTITTPAMGWTIIKEIEWAKQFHVDDHFGTPTDDFGAQWRFVGMVIMAEAKMQAQYALQMLTDGQGLIHNSNGAVDWAGQWIMLEALSDLASALDAPTMLHSTTNRYADPAAAAMFRSASDMLFGALRTHRPAGVEELSLALQALPWYAAAQHDAGRQAQAVAQLHRHGNALAIVSKTALTGATPAVEFSASDWAYAIRGLLEVHRITGQQRYLSIAGLAFDRLQSAYDPSHGVFTRQDSYTIDDVAIIMGALNSLKLFAGDAVDQNQVETIFTDFFESAVNMSGLQQSAPPIDALKDPFEQEDPPIYYAYPGMPMPPMAGGAYGVAPVFATEVTWDGSQWSVTNNRFDSAGAMHASNEFIWFHNDEVDGFPIVP
ncbi:MAG: hypothetical protein IAE85_14635 [Anaerolinea sp.]|nr:hypothetical protein [Anaerolinea sp.]